MRSVSYRVYVILVLSFTCAESMVLSSSGGYSRITVKISEDYPESKCAKLLSSLRLVLSGASRAVGDAVDWEVWPAQFIIIVPAHWSEDTCRTVFLSPSGLTRYTGQDMVVLPGLVHAATHPHTVQTGGCAEPGVVTNIPATFLLNTTQDMDTKYKQLAHEFFKLRFGIFDERGYAGDPVYPDHFIDDNKIRVTAVSDNNEHISGHWTHPSNGSVCGHGVEGCVFSLEPDTKLRCSLGSWPHEPSVTTYCDHDHDLAPTKHSALCQGVSAKSVILNSPDLQFLRRLHVPKPNRDSFVPEIVTVQERSERIVLLVETSVSMLDHDDWRWVTKSLQKLLRYDLGDEAEVGLVTFSHVGELVANVTRLGDIRHRHHLADMIPDHYRLGRNTGTACLVCGVNTALETLGEDKQAGHIIIVNRGGRVTDRERRKLMEYAEYYQVKMSSVLVTRSDHVSVYSDLGHATDGQLRQVTPASTNIVKYTQISDALARILSTQKIVIHERKVESTETVTRGNIVIDSTASINVVFGIFVSDTEDHFIKSVTFTDSDSGTVHGPFRGVSSVMDNINMKTVSYGVGRQCVLTPGHWRYQVEWATGHERRESVILVTSDRDSEDYNIHVWTSARGPETVVTSLHPVSVHVSVTKGHQAVLRASVTAVITAPAVNDKLLLQLLDNGSGDADLVKDDGVYSRYMTQYPGPGVYTISVSVTDNDNQAVMAAVNDYPVTAAGHHQCCGSTTNINVASATRTGAFQRHVASAATLNIIEVPGSSHDNMPPSRVGDLRLVSMDSNAVAIQFTSPGDDHDHGAISEFIVVQDKQKENIMKSWSEDQMLTRFSVRNVTAGDLVEKSLAITSYPDFFIGVVGVDEAGNHGVMSNIIHIVMINTIYSTSSNDAVIEIPAAAATVNKEDDSEWSLILALCSTFLLLALCLFGGVLYFLRCASPHKRSLVDIGVSDDVTDPDTVSHCSSEIRHMCQLDVTDLMMADQELRGRPWCEQELRRTPVSPVTALLRHGTLTPITEEYLGHFTEFGDSDYHDIPDTTGASMAAVTSTPLRNVNRNIAVMDSCTDLTSNASEPQEPEKFSLGVQTVAPSCVANIRQSRELVQHQIYASLV